MLLLSLLLWYSRRTEPLSLRDAQRCLAIILVTLFLLPADSSTPACQGQDIDAIGKKLLLREGTRIPSTTGRIVMVGRRWAFVPIADETKSEVVTEDELTVARAYMITESQLRATRLGSSGVDYGRNRFQTAATPLSELTRRLPAAFEQITLQENLMLQRIVKAIRADATDDHWVISGEITEFLNENLLVIRLAQRANRR